MFSEFSYLRIDILRFEDLRTIILRLWEASELPFSGPQGTSELLFSESNHLRIDILRVGISQNYYSEAMGCLRTAILRATGHLRTIVLRV